MTLPEFDYVAAKSLKEASDLMVSKGKAGIVMSGGTDVIVYLKDRAIPEVGTVIDLKTIPDLDYITYVEGEGVHIGANTKLFTIQNSEIVKEHIPALAEAAHSVASTQIRRKATMVGNICNASPSADTAPILLAMNATVNTFSPECGRSIPIDEFFTGFKTVAPDKAKGELVTEVVVPELGSCEGSAYFKHAVRKAMDLAIIGVAVWLKMAGSHVSDARIALGGVAITPMRATVAEKELIGQEISEELLEQVGIRASCECEPISDVRASAEYRKDMVRVYTKRAIKKAIETLKA